MRIDVSLRITDNLQARALAAAPALIEQELRKTMTGSVLLLENDITQRVTVGATANLRGATMTSVTGTGMDVTGRVWNPTLYGPPVESGGRAHWAPLANIERWARRVIGGANSGRVARAVWVAISKAGTKAKPFWAPAWASQEPVIRRRHDAMLTRIARRLRGEA